MNEHKKRINKLLHKARVVAADKAISQAEIADKMDVTAGRVSRLINGYGNITACKLEELLSHLGLTLEVKER